MPKFKVNVLKDNILLLTFFLFFKILFKKIYLFIFLNRKKEDRQKTWSCMGGEVRMLWDETDEGRHRLEIYCIKIIFSKKIKKDNLTKKNQSSFIIKNKTMRTGCNILLFSGYFIKTKVKLHKVKSS